MNRTSVQLHLKKIVRFAIGESLILITVMALGHFAENLGIYPDDIGYLILFLVLSLRFVRRFLCNGALSASNVLIYGQKRSNKLLLFFSYLFCLMYLVGLLLSKDVSLTGNNTIFLLTGAVALTPIAYQGALCMFRMIGMFSLAEHSDQKSEQKNLNWKLLFIGMFLLWMPTLLTFFPGLFTNDVPGQVPQRIGSYNTHHPLLHTLLLQLFLAIGNLLHSANAGVCLMCVLQAFFLALALTEVLKYLWDCGCSRRAVLVLWLFFSLFPVYPVMAISTTKDVPFTICWIIFLLFLGNTNRSKRADAMFIVVAVLAMLFRNNAVLAVPISILAVALLNKKAGGKKLLLQLALIGLLYLLSNGLLVNLTQASSDPTKRELLSVPCQQVARVYVKERDSLSQKEREEILRYIPGAADYHETLADYTKDQEQIDYDWLGFLKLYFQLGKKFPLRYLEAVLYNTMGYWYVNDRTAEAIYGVGSSQGSIGYFYMYQWEHYGVHSQSLLPKMKKLCYWLFGWNYYHKIPVLSSLFKYAISIWLILLSWGYAVYTDHRNCYGKIIADLILLLTFLLGPCSCLRYAFPFITTMPMIFISATINGDNINDF